MKLKNNGAVNNPIKSTHTDGSRSRRFRHQMRVPAAHRHMGRSIAGKAPIGNRGRDSKGRIRPNRTPTKAQVQRRQSEMEVREAEKRNSRGQQVNRLRPGAIHARWGSPADMTGKGHGQDHIIQYATAAGICSCLLLVSAAGLGSLNDSRPSKENIAINSQGAGMLAGWLYVKAGTTMFTSIVACCLRSYWVWSDYNGSAKLRTYVGLMFVDWCYGLFVLILMLANYVDHAFWWVGLVILVLFSGASLRTMFDIVYAVGRKLKEKKIEKEITETKEETSNNGMVDPQEVKAAASTSTITRSGAGNSAAAEKIDILVMAESAEPSAPPIQYDDPPAAPSSPVRADRMMQRPAPPTSSGSGINSIIMNKKAFEQKWLRLPQLSSRNDTFLPPIPGMGDIKMHLKARNFDVVASGTLEGITRVYMHQQVSSDVYMLAEIVISVGHDASAHCTLTTTIKVDAIGLGNPNLGRIVDSMELALLFRY